MTKFQALFVLWLRHESMCACSWRALSGNYNARYNDGSIWKYKGIGGNQIDGIMLEEEAFKILFPERLFMQPIDLYDCDLMQISKEFNIKNHYDN